MYIPIEQDFMKSKGEISLLEILRQEVPHFTIISQHGIKIKHRQHLYLDYYIPMLKLAVEFDGLQHEQYIPYFHKDIQGFMRSQQADKAKDQYCLDNDISLIRINHDEEVDAQTLRNKIQELIKKRIVNE